MEDGVPKSEDFGGEVIGDWVSIYSIDLMN